MPYSDLIEQNIVENDTVSYMYMYMDVSETGDETSDFPNTGMLAISPVVITKNKLLVKSSNDLETSYLIENIVCDDILDKIVNSEFKGPSSLDIDILSPNNQGLNLATLTRRVFSKILAASNYIAVESRFGAGEFIILNQQTFDELLVDSAGIHVNGNQYELGGMRILITDKVPNYKIYVYRKSLKFFINESTGKYGLYSDKDVWSLCISILNFSV